MLNFLLRRLGYSLIMIVLVSFVSFIIIELPPGDYLTQKIEQLRSRGDRSAEQQVESLRLRYGLDKPFLERYWTWATNFLKGDFGQSFEFDRPVSEILGARLGYTVVLALSTVLITWALAIPLGVYSAVKQYSIGDQIISIISFIGLGMPGFLLALIILYFAVIVFNLEVVGLFSPEYRDAPWSMAKFLDLLGHLWLPALISAITGIGGLVRIMRGNLLETLGQPFVESARARGLRNTTVTWKHAVRIAINPLVTILGSDVFPAIVIGSSLVAIVLNLPTIGPIFVDSLRKLDMYMAGTCIVFLTLMLLIGNLISDLLLAWVDPRIRLE
jgi:peptide/nickel transport system permease protein